MLRQVSMERISVVADEIRIWQEDSLSTKRSSTDRSVQEGVQRFRGMEKGKSLSKRVHACAGAGVP